MTVLVKATATSVCLNYTRCVSKCRLEQNYRPYMLLIRWPSFLILRFYWSRQTFGNSTDFSITPHIYSAIADTATFAMCVDVASRGKRSYNWTFVTRTVPILLEKVCSQTVHICTIEHPSFHFTIPVYYFGFAASVNVNE